MIFNKTYRPDEGEEENGTFSQEATNIKQQNLEYNPNIDNLISNDNERYPITNIVKECQLFSDLPDREKLEKKKTVIYMIDSRDRNMDLYPDPANYKIDLSEEFRDIRELELLSVQMPKNIYTINNNNDKLKIYYGDHEVTVSLLHGCYKDGEELANSLETTLNNCHQLINNPKITVTYNKRLHKLIFRSHNILDNKGNINSNGFLTFYLQGNRYPYGDGNTFETCLPDRSCGSIIGFRAKVYDMFAGIVAINEIDSETTNISDLSDTIKECEDKIYYMRQLQGDIVDKLKIPYNIEEVCDKTESNNRVVNNPKTTKSVIKYLDTIYIRRCDHPDDEFIPVTIYNEDSCLERENITGWFVTINEKYKISHGKYEVFVDYIISEDMIDLEPYKYILLQIPKCHRFNSLDTITRKSFAKIPLQVGEYRFNAINVLGNIKFFNPILGGLTQLHIKFYPYKKHGDLTNNKTFDFAGGEHVLTFAIVHYKQPLKYGS